ncbi:class I histocompatibility antigen, Gogo-A*0501 alpha chain-like isoform X2 [Narcine bancroftii]|uniref:class I histocompatibility antigen, Gogo-A*0501 alpha chain-like isoform X2 n=1 Tax=Narcine bancroftii TaxID=1343680 RepID=UPI00383161C0
MESWNGRLSLLALSALYSVSGSLSASHSLKYLFNFSFNVPQQPTFSRVGMLDDLQIDYYNSSLMQVEPRKPWMKGSLLTKYWNQQKEISRSVEKLLSEELRIYASFFSIHYLEGMWGCTQSESTTNVFVNLKTETAGEIDCDIIIMKCSATGIFAATNDPLSILDEESSPIRAVNASCISDLQNILKLGKAALERKVAPELVLFIRSLSPEEGDTLVCLITPFYPRAINATWLRNGQAVSAGSNATVLQNQDGTYWMELLIELQGRDPRTFSCQVQHSSLSETLTVRADSNSIEIKQREDVKEAR